MRIRVDCGGTAAAGSGLRALADDARRLAGGAGRVATEVTEPSLAEGLRVLGDACSDVLEVVALDLDLLATCTTAGAVGYDAVEHHLAR